ncbi:hypothetical protein [Streptomyces boninensis]|uniref:hypothetical protein n=1 Tax=Streptomyces boninensis TaxID=2039455 RepID=UPI003B2158D3
MRTLLIALAGLVLVLHPELLADVLMAVGLAVLTPVGLSFTAGLLLRPMVARHLRGWAA